MIRAEFIDGHWRVIDDFECRYMPNHADDDGAVGGLFASRKFATDNKWDEATRLDERSALLLAGVLRKLHDAQQECQLRILSTCEPCRSRFRNAK